MDARRLRIDLFAFALGALALLSLAFLGARNGAALVMCALCFAGLLAARMAGFSNRALVPVALGLVVILWMVWIDPPTTGRRTTTLAHFAGGALVGWALAEYLRGRIAWPLWGLAALAGVFGLTILWEFGEYLGDTVLTTGLIPSRTDSAVDILFGTLGGGAAVAIGWLLMPARRHG
jgi:hypothetical protein